jgi:TRAP-type mannitol/chloroaromatic compound transport system permease small subunit
VTMKILLMLSRAIDALNEQIGRLVYWLVLVAVLISAANAMSRYLLNKTSNGWLEMQWYLFAAIFLLCAGYTLRHNEHIRIDVVSQRFSRKTQIWVDIFGTIFFMLPMTIFIMVLGWSMFKESYLVHEVSADPGGLLRWPVKLLVPVGFFLLTLQGVSELIKRIAFLMGLVPDPLEKHVEAALEMVQDEVGEGTK